MNFAVQAILILSAIVHSSGAANGQTPKVIIGDTSEYTRIEEPQVLTKLIRARQVRRATAMEMARVLNGNRYFATRRDARQPFYVIENANALALISSDEDVGFSYFIIPAKIRGREFGRTVSTFLTPAGGCLEGQCGPCAPNAAAGHRSDQIIDGCYPSIPLAP